jgi:hypothetical protein
MKIKKDSKINEKNRNHRITLKGKKDGTTC